MPYVLQADIAARIPTAFLAQALDDDADGVADAGAWDAVAASAASVVDGILGGRFTTPFTAPLPPAVSNAAQIFALEILFQRRGVAAESNPWAKQADDMRSMLRQIAAGKLPLSPEVKRANPSGVLISESSKTHDRQGRRLV